MELSCGPRTADPLTHSLYLAFSDISHLTFAWLHRRACGERQADFYSGVPERPNVWSMSFLQPICNLLSLHMSP